MTNFTGMTAEFFRRCGWTCAITEHWVSRPWKSPSGKMVNGFRKDLFGCIDVLAVRPGRPVTGIQATSRHNVNARVKKCLQIPEVEQWLLAGCRLLVVGWEKVGAKWEYMEVELKAGDCEPVVNQKRRRKTKSAAQPELFKGF